MEHERALNEFRNNLRNCLNEKNLSAAINLINANKDEQEIQSSLSEIIPLIVVHINEDVQREKPKLFCCCKQIINVIADSYDVEGVLLQIIEDVEQAVDDTAFLTLINPLEKVLLRLPKRRLNSLEWGLNAVRLYLSALSLPDNLNLEEEEEILMDADPRVERISALYLSLLPFYDCLLEDLERDETNKSERKIILVKFMMELLGKPLAFLDLKCSQKTKSRARRVAESLVKRILHVVADIFWILELQTVDCTSNLRQVDVYSMATFFYLVLTENVFLEKVPKVYDCVYVFQTTLHLATKLLTHDNQFVVYNGLQLSEALLDRVSHVALSHQLLDSRHHSRYCFALKNVIIYNQLERYRKKSLGILRRYILNFEMRGRFLLVYNLVKVVNHAGLIGYIITLYKDIIVEELKKHDHSSIYLTGSKLFLLLDIFCSLHKYEETDLIELADQIVASLNLLRFLIILDKTNSTGIWDHIKILKKTYFKPLEEGLDIARAHYELKIKVLQMENGKGDSMDEKFSVTVGGHQLSDVPTNEKLKLLYAALTSFDVIQSLLARVNELINAKTM